MGMLSTYSRCGTRALACTAGLTRSRRRSRSAERSRGLARRRPRLAISHQRAAAGGRSQAAGVSRERSAYGYAVAGFSSQRFAVKHPRWEPYAGKPHVRFCAGGAQ